MGEKRIIEGDVYGVIYPADPEPHNFHSYHTTGIDTNQEDELGLPVVVLTSRMLDDFKDKRVRITIEEL